MMGGAQHPSRVVKAEGRRQEWSSGRGVSGASPHLLEDIFPLSDEFYVAEPAHASAPAGSVSDLPLPT